MILSWLAGPYDRSMTAFIVITSRAPHGFLNGQPAHPECLFVVCVVITTQTTNKSIAGLKATAGWSAAGAETRTTGSPALLRYYDGLLAIMRDGGFTWDQAHHALHALGSRALGFSQKLFTPPGGAADGIDQATAEAMAAQFPHLASMLADIVHDDPASTLGWCDDQEEFEFGLDLILYGLDRIRPANGTRPAGGGLAAG